MSASAICARDLAALWAAMIATTNAGDATKAKVDSTTGKAARRYGEQGFISTHDLCIDPATTKAWDAAGAKTKPLSMRCLETKLATPAWSLVADVSGKACHGDTRCGKTSAKVRFFPAGPLAL